LSGKGFFVKEIEEALLKGQADLAIHSMKDLPSEIPKGLILSAITKREDPKDILILRTKDNLKTLKSKAKIGTSSLRRASQILALRPDLNIIPIRGNVDTRLKKLKEGKFDGIILAKAALLRLKIQDIFFYEFDIHEMLPAVGQGALAIEIREQDKLIREITKPLDHLPTRLSIEAERIFLQRLQGGCRIPITAYAHLASPSEIKIKGMIGLPNGSKIIYSQEKDKDPTRAGIKLAKSLLLKGGKEVLNILKTKHN
jgi:hydroxymethylbilane synthase